MAATGMLRVGLQVTVSVRPVGHAVLGEAMELSPSLHPAHPLPQLKLAAAPNSRQRPRVQRPRRLEATTQLGRVTTGRESRANRRGLLGLIHSREQRRDHNDIHPGRSSVRKATFRQASHRARG